MSAKIGRYPQSGYTVYVFELHGEKVGDINIYTNSTDEKWKEKIDNSNNNEEVFIDMYCSWAEEDELLVEIFNNYGMMNFNYDLCHFMQDNDRIPTKKEWEKLKVVRALQ